MNSDKMRCRLLLALTLSSAGVLTLLASTEAATDAGLCGADLAHGATPGNGCLAVVCNTRGSVCNGAATDYYCTSSVYTASCSTMQYVLSMNGEGQDYCAYPGTPGADVPAPCVHVTGEVLGCSE